MRAFILICVLAVVYADKLGYNYRPVPHSPTGLSFAPGVRPAAHQQHASSHHEAHQSSSRGEALLSGAIESNAGSGVNLGLLSQPVAPLPQTSLPRQPSLPQPLAPQPQPVLQPQPVPQPQPGPISEEYQKEFYSYSAPEDDSSEPVSEQQATNSLKKNIRVVFIRAPESKNLERAALTLAQQAAEDRTAIYVLTKQPDVSNLAQQLQVVKSQSSSKPEVHFVKYRTHEDAQNAQRVIQAQYEELPGGGSIVSEGQASVLNFASRASVRSGPLPPGPEAQYLPSHPVPSNIYFKRSKRNFS